MKYDNWDENFKDEIDYLSKNDVDKWDISSLVNKFEDKILKVSLELFKGIDEDV
jgi:hypothetical protein